jgi:hypothetical protein
MTREKALKIIEDAIIALNSAKDENGLLQPYLTLELGEALEFFGATPKSSAGGQSK